jgi:hypothetical protein
MLLDMPVPGAVGGVVRVTARFPDWTAGFIPPVINDSPERNEGESTGKSGIGFFVGYPLEPGRNKSDRSTGRDAVVDGRGGS